MKFVFEAPKILTESISIISELVSEANLKIDKNGIEIVALDPANVAMVEFKLFPQAFSEFSSDGEKRIGLNLDQFKQILRRIKPTDKLEVFLDEEKSKLRIKVLGRTTKNFGLSLVDVEESEQKVPNLNFVTKIETESKIINDAIDDMEVISEAVSFIAEKDKLTISSGNNLQDAEVVIKNGGSTKIETKEKTKAKYSLEYLKKMMKGSKLSEKIILEYSKDYPIKVSYEIGKKLKLGFILAPRIDSE